MTDIFDNAILCRKCGKTMKPMLLNRNGFNLRTMRCEKCNETIVHPVDKQEYEEFMRLKNKDFEVKMRMVGNSYAVSIPREIVDFMQDQENMMNNMVKMCFEEAGRISLKFNTPNNENLINKENANQRIVKAREVRVVRNNQPVLHVRQVSDSAHPERNKTQVFRNKTKEQEEEEEYN
jgi:hypothetical protein